MCTTIAMQHFTPKASVTWIPMLLEYRKASKLLTHVNSGASVLLLPKWQPTGLKLYSL